MILRFFCILDSIYFLIFFLHLRYKKAIPTTFWNLNSWPVFTLCAVDVKQCQKQLPTIPTVYYCQISDTQKDSKDDNQKVGVEEQKKVLSNPATKLSDFVNADETTKTTVTTNTEELCQPVKSGNGIEDGGNDKEATEEPAISCVW